MGHDVLLGEVRFEEMAVTSPRLGGSVRLLAATPVGGGLWRGDLAITTLDAVAVHELSGDLLPAPLYLPSRVGPKLLLVVPILTMVLNCGYVR